MSDAYILRTEFDLAPLVRFIKNRDYLLSARARFYVLKGAVEYLTHVRDCVRTRVRAALRRGRRLVAAMRWMEEADRCILAFDKLQGEYDLIPKLFWGPSLDFWSSYSVGKDASEMLPQVTRLCAEGAEIVRTVKFPQPMDVSTGFASRDQTLRAAIARVKDEKGGIVGIWGRAGLGKTHFTKLMEEYFLRDDSFDLVLRIMVQRDYSVSKVQAEIAKKLMLANYEGNQNKARIFDFLKERNFLLLVDCLWHWVDLEEIGVPSLDQVGIYRRKLVFTTCLSHVCDQMNVELGDRIEVHRLAPTESLGFLRHNPDIDYFGRLYMFLQRNISKELLGSPLDLITIGKAMHSKKEAKYWENALGYLSQSCLNETQGEDTEEAAFFRLKLVYDSLTENLKACFKSCSLWPEGHIFDKMKLVDFWIGMGLLQQGDIEKAYNEGFSIISTLQELCLVQSAEDDEAVQMQPTIRDFVLWLVNNQGKSKDKWAIQSKKDWGLAEKVLLVGLKITELPYIPSNQESLTVLILQKNCLKGSSLSNFHQLHSLQYLDLSFNKFFGIPLEICLLVHLRYLNLSHNMIKTLPMELGYLTKLRHLHLRNNPIQVIPNGILPQFQNLAVLDICSFDFVRCPSSCVVSLDELEFMDSLQSLGITVHLDILRTRISKTTLPIRALCVVAHSNGDGENIPNFSNSPSLNPDRCTNLFELGIYTWERTIVFDGIHSMWNLRHVEKAYLRGCYVNKIIWQRLRPEDIFASLRRLDIVQCRNLTSVSWILHLPLLQDLLLFSCSKLHQIIATSDGVIETSTSNEKEQSSSTCNTFPRLKKMTLIEADRLVSICSPTFGFPSLECLQIYACPSLKKLPFLTVPRKLKFIRGENEWWDGLEWQDTGLQSSLELYFHGFTSEDQLSEMHLFNCLQVEWARIHEDFGE